MQIAIFELGVLLPLIVQLFISNWTTIVVLMIICIIGTIYFILTEIYRMYRAGPRRYF